MNNDEIKNVQPVLHKANVGGSPSLSEKRVIKFKCIVTGNNKEKIAEFTEWLDCDGWKHDYYAPLVTNGVFSHEEVGDGWFGEIIRSGLAGDSNTGHFRRFRGIVKGNLHEGFRLEASKNFMELGLKRYEYKIIGNIYENVELLRTVQQ